MAARSRHPQPDDIFTHLDRVDNSLLECINRAENTMNAKEHDAPAAKFNQYFDNFMSGLNNTDPLNSDYIQINPKFLDPNDDPNDERCNPHMVDEQSKAKKMWDNFQSGSRSQQAPEEHIP